MDQRNYGDELRGWLDYSTPVIAVNTVNMMMSRHDLTLGMVEAETTKQCPDRLDLMDCVLTVFAREVRLLQAHITDGKESLARMEETLATMRARLE